MEIKYAQPFCSQCLTGMTKSETTHGLVKWEKRPDGSVNINSTNIFPVRPWLCQSCGHVELRFEAP